MFTEQANLTINKESYPIIALQGEEMLSSPFAFELTIPLENNESIFNIHDPAWLNITDSEGNERIIRGEVNHISEISAGKFPQVKLTLTARLNRLFEFSGARVYLNQKVQSLVNELLKRHAGYLDHQIFWHGELLSPNLDFVLQTPGENDFDFMQRQLQQAGWFYWLTTDQYGEEAIHFSQSATLLPSLNYPLEQHDLHGLGADQGFYKSAKQSQKIKSDTAWSNYDEEGFDTQVLKTPRLNNQKTTGEWENYGWLHPRQVNFQAIADQENQYKAMSELSESGKSHQVELQPSLLVELAYQAGDKKTHVIKKVYHKAQYPMPGDGSGDIVPYSNTWELLNIENDITTPLPKSLPHFGPCPAVIEAYPGQSSTLIDQSGRYQVRLLFDESGKSHTEASIPLSCISYYGGNPSATGVGNQSVGEHFPLRDGAKVLVGFINQDPNRPVIIGSIPTEDQPTPVNKNNAKDNTVKTVLGNQLLMNDNEQQSGMAISTAKKENALIMQDNAATNDVALQSLKGNVLHFSKKSLHQKTASDWHETIDHNSHHHVEKDFQLQSTKQNIQEQSGHDWNLKSEQQQLQSQGNHSFQAGRDIQMNVKSSTNIKAKSLNLASKSSEVLLHGSGGTMKSESPIHITNGGAGIKLEPSGEITVYGTSIGSASLSGTVNQHQSPKPFPSASKGTDASDQALQNLKNQNQKKQAKSATHWVDLAYQDEDGDPIAYQPYVINFSDGSKLYSKLDANGQAHHEAISPGPVKVTYGNPERKEQVQDALQKKLKRLKVLLKAMLNEIQEKAKAQNEALQQKGYLGQKYKYAESFVSGLYDSAKDGVEGLVKLAEKATSASETLFEDLKNNNIKAIKQALQNEKEKFFLTEKLIKKVLTLLNYSPTRNLLTGFAKNYFQDQSSTEKAKMAGGLSFNILLILCTGGEGGAIEATEATSETAEATDATQAALSGSSILASKNAEQTGRCLSKIADDVDTLKKAKTVEGGSDEVLRAKASQITASSSELTAKERSQLFQGKDPYFGVDSMENTMLEEGDLLAQVTFRDDGVPISEYFTTESVIDACRNNEGLIDGNKLNQGLQVYVGDDPVTGKPRSNFKKNIYFYRVKEKLKYGEVAVGKTEENSHLNPDGYDSLMQLFINKENFDKLEALRLERSVNNGAPEYNFSEVRK